MVRLKVWSHNFVFASNRKFQFLYGAIKRDFPGFLLCLLVEFQFLYGAIKSSRRCR